MIFEEVKRDLFSVSTDEYCLAQCISADAKMGKGIAVEFQNRFPMTATKYMAHFKLLKVGDCIHDDRVINLITKEKYHQKPTYRSLRASLETMRDLAIENGIKKIAMPAIGCGLDRLQWNKVRKIIQDTFDGVDVEILICIKD